MLLSAVLAGCGPLRAQGPGALAVQSYGPEEGLGNPNVEAIAEDPAGFLWFATEGGLYRFEGRRFRRFGPGEGLEAPRVRALASDGSGLFAGTAGGLFRYEGGEFSPVKGLGKPVFSLCAGPGGLLWAGAGDGLYVVQPGHLPQRLPEWTGRGPALLSRAAGGGVWTVDGEGGVRRLAWRDGRRSAP